MSLERVGASVLGQGQLAVSAGVIYTVPSSTSAEITNITLINSSTTDSIAIILYLKGTSASNEWARHVLDGHEWTEWTGTLHLRAGETIAGSASTATAITYTISGNENG